MTVYAVCTCLTLLTSGPSQVVFDWQFPDARIIELLTPGCKDFDKGNAFGQLLEAKAKAFPAYRRILKGSSANEEVRGAVLNMVATAKDTDRRAFRSHAIRAVTSDYFGLRQGGIRVLCELGDAKDATIAVALLHDEDEGVIRAAAECLVRLGGERELIALDAWLRPIEKRLGKRCDFRDYHVQLKDRLRAGKQASTP